MKAASHPPYSPDLAGSDFSIFDFLKGYFASLSFENVNELLENVRAFFGISTK
jgi:hypothetical protein